MKNCIQCGTPFEESGRKLSCSLKCAKKRQNQQLADLTKRRQLERTPKVLKPCIICLKPFFPNHAKHNYCGTKCAKVGLEHAIERQRQRRKEVKEAKAKLTQSNH